MGAGATLATPVFASGSWICKCSSPPDRNVPASFTPPGVAPGSGFWAMSGFSGYPVSVPTRFTWIPLPLGQVQMVPNGQGGTIPMIAFGGIVQLTQVTGTLASGAPAPPHGLKNGPVFVVGGAGGPAASAPGYVAVPTTDPSTWPAPSGLSGGTWTKGVGDNLYFYNQGSTGSSGAGLWAVAAAGLALVAGGAYALS